MDKNYLVTKSNYFIMNSSYDLSLEEQKIILTLASMVQPNDEEFKPYIFKISDFMKIVGVENQAKYSEIPKITKELMKKVFEIEEGNKIIQTAWLSGAIYEKGSGYVILKFNPDLKPYMLKLSSMFTQYRLANILSMKSKYSPRIYEILKCNQFKNKGNITIEINELRKLLKTETIYSLYSDFKRKVIIQTQIELKRISDINFEFEEIKSGRKVVAIKFIIKPNKENKKIPQDKVINDSFEKEVLESESILILKELFQDQVSIKNLKKILESANNDIEKIKKIYEYSKTQKIDNLVGFMIKMVKDGNFEEPIKQDKDYKKIHNFTEREDYDYQKLEKGLLGWDNDEIMESIEENKINANEGAKMDFNGEENENRSNNIDEIKNILEGQLTAIFGELRYKTWIKPSVDNIEIENNNIKFVFSNNFVKKKFENEFENIIKEIIKGIDNNFNVEKITN